MRDRRRREEFEFIPPETGSVLERMHELSEARDGWLNLLPGVPEEEAARSQGGIFSALFGGAQAPVTMCTWMPAKSGRAGLGEQSIGILHPRGRRAASQLGGLGAPVPFGWRVGQDHPRRGLIVHPSAGAPRSQVLDWMLGAASALALAPLTGTWQARVFLPLDAPRNTGAPGER